ncbi:hypothetical protein LINGRAHAP2_LOCUS29552 [Linum grandiflorum]
MVISTTSDPEPTPPESPINGGGGSLKRLTIGLPLSISSLVAHCAKPKLPKPAIPPPPTPTQTRHLQLHLYLNGDSPLVRRSKRLLTQIRTKTNHNNNNNQDGQTENRNRTERMVRQSKQLLAQISNKAITLVHGNKKDSKQQKLDIVAVPDVAARESCTRSPAPVVLRQYSKKILTQIGNKAVTLVHRSKSGKEGRSSEMEDEFGDGGVWQRSILMGDKCQPLAFSGVIYYDSRGKRMNNDERQLALRDSPFHHACPTCGK